MQTPYQTIPSKRSTLFSNAQERFEETQKELIAALVQLKEAQTRGESLERIQEFERQAKAAEEKAKKAHDDLGKPMTEAIMVSGVVMATVFAVGAGLKDGVEGALIGGLIGLGVIALGGAINAYISERNGRILTGSGANFTADLIVGASRKLDEVESKMLQIPSNNKEAAGLHQQLISLKYSVEGMKQGYYVNYLNWPQVHDTHKKILALEKQVDRILLPDHAPQAHFEGPKWIENSQLRNNPNEIELTTLKKQ